jgi:hypothetical protein
VFAAAVTMQVSEPRPAVANVSEPHPQLMSVESPPQKAVMTCAGCGRVIEWGQPRVARWNGWTEGEPVPEGPERVWHDYECLYEDKERGRVAALAPRRAAESTPRREALEGRLKRRA